MARAAQGLGHGNVTLDRQMTVRTHPAYMHYRSALLPSMPLRMAISSLKQKPAQVLAEPDRVQLKGFTIPLVKGMMLISYRLGRDALPRYSFADILKNEKMPRSIKGRNIFIGFNASDSRHVPTPISANMSENEVAARILDNILHRDFISRPGYMGHVEALAIVLLGCFAVFFFPTMRPLPRLAWALGLVILTLVLSFILFTMMQVWFRATYIGTFVIVVFLVFSIRDLFSGERVTQQSLETNRLLGLSFQSQGLLDLAFDKFKKLPFDNETMDLVYNLGLEYERKRMINKAIEAYEFVNKGGGFRDLDDRIPKLKDTDKSSTLGSHGQTKDPNILAEAAQEAVTKLGRYDILGTLGKGSMGLVYKALDPKINRLLAIKTIRFSEEFDEDVISEIKERFFREAEIAGQLSHPSIVTIYDVGEHGDLTYMAMEFLEGKDLENYISKKNLLPLRKVLDIVARVADALHYAHKNDVIHRDIKPANIMLLDGGGVKVTDFGIAKAISSSRTKTGVILGTPNYMSPEQIMGQKIDQRSDIFSLGVLFFQLLTGETPFHGDNLSSLLYQITQVKHPAAREYNPKIPKVCEKIVDKALAKNPVARFKTAGEMGQYIKLLATKLDQLMNKGPK
jgi:serine/threonine-protein kinase